MLLGLAFVEIGLEGCHRTTLQTDITVTFLTVVIPRQKKNVLSPYQYWQGPKSHEAERSEGGVGGWGWEWDWSGKEGHGGRERSIQHPTLRALFAPG